MAGRSRTYAERRTAKAEVDDPQVVVDAAARFLETRPRSVAEVRRRLVGVGYRKELVDGAIDRLVDIGILDDAAFARWWIESRDRARPRGSRALRSELLAKGVDRAVIDAVLEERSGGAQESIDSGEPVDIDRGAADRLLERHRRSLDRVADPRMRRQRAYALLARHGFDPETCREAVTALLASDD